MTWAELVLEVEALAERFGVDVDQYEIEPDGPDVDVYAVSLSFERPPRIRLHQQ